MLRIKICGLTTPQDAAAAIEFGADALGFNFFPGSKRYLQVEQSRDWISALPGTAEKVGILVDPSPERAREIAALPGITALQLHGIETPQFCRQLAEEGIRFEKAIAVPSAGSLATLPDFFTRRVLLDSGGPGQFGGSGRTFPWGIAREFVSANPHLRVILAGGLTPENVAEAISMVRPFGVDVTSGVESTPGRKDHGRMRAFIAAAQGS
jgi:phosphoribosylanthranilate isomerase